MQGVSVEGVRFLRVGTKFYNWAKPLYVENLAIICIKIIKNMKGKERRKKFSEIFSQIINSEFFIVSGKGRSPPMLTFFNEF